MVYKVTLFFHLVGAFLLLGAIVVEHVVGARLRRSQSVQEVRAYAGTLVGSTKLFPISTVLLILTGGYMAHLLWTFTTPFVDIGLVLLIGTGAAAPNLHGKRIAQLFAAAQAEADGPLTPALINGIRSPGLWVPAFATTGIAVSIVWVMTQKPSWVEGIASVVLITAVLGVVGQMVARRTLPESQAAVSAS